MSKKQIVIIMTDTQRRDMLGCYGGKQAHTPNLDRLASEGMLFERAYCCDPVCMPARSSLFTGTYPHTNGAWTNCLALGQDMLTVAQRLSAQGIHCGYVGKWHLDGDDFGLGKAPAGWDPEYWFDLRNYCEELPDETSRQLRQTDASGQVPEEICYAHRFNVNALKFIEKHKDEDFLLVVSFEEPHHPHVAPEPFASMYDDVEMELDDNVFEADMSGKPELHRVWAEEYSSKIPESFRHTKKLFYASNAYVDYEIGRIIDAIDKYCPEAMTIYTADHGFSMGNRGGLFDKGPASYEEITGVPLIVRKRGLVPAGVRHSGVASHIDITPTVLDYMGLELSPMLEGKSMLPLLENKEEYFRSEVFVEFGRFTLPHDGFGGFQPYRTCVTEDYKLCINLLDIDELYDLKNDPDELHNLIDSPEHSAIRDEMHNKILDWMNDTRDPFRGYHWERRPWRKDARPASYRYTGLKRIKPGDPGFKPQPIDYNTGKTSANGAYDPFKWQGR